MPGGCLLDEAAFEEMAEAGIERMIAPRQRDERIQFLPHVLAGCSLGGKRQLRAGAVVERVRGADFVSFSHANFRG
jgi:hypothetical protein